MGDIDDHALCLHAPHDLAAQRGEAALFQAVHRPGKFIVEEMGDARHAESGGVQLVQIVDIAFEVVQSLDAQHRSEEHTSELQSLMRISYAVFCLKKKKHTNKVN